MLPLQRYSGYSQQDAHHCNVLTQDGALEPGEMSIAELRHHTCAPLRDLLQLDLGSHASTAPCVLPRGKATLVALGGFKAVVTPSEARFFDAGKDPRAAVRRLGNSVKWAKTEVAIHALEKLSGTAESEDALPFELLVLEGVLAEVCAGYARRCDLYRPVIRRTLDGVAGDGDGVEGLHRLAAFEGALAQFENEVNTTLRVVAELLSSDQDMLGLVLSEPDPSPDRHEVVELMLESYHRQLLRVTHAIGDLRASVKRAGELARVTIDLHRNHIIKFNLYLSMSAVGLAATTAVAGIFGMNLVSGVEEAGGAFMAVTLGSAVVGAGVVLGFHSSLTHHARIEERARTASDDRLALAGLLENLATVEHVLDAAAEEARHVTRADCAAMLEAGSGRAPSERQLELLFEIFDASHDDAISTEEAKHLLSGGRKPSEDEPEKTSEKPASR